MLVAIGGRIARAYIAETRDVYRPKWRIDDVAEAEDAILDKSEILDFGLHGHAGHIGYSFAGVRAAE